MAEADASSQRKYLIVSTADGLRGPAVATRVDPPIVRAHPSRAAARSTQSEHICAPGLGKWCCGEVSSLRFLR